MCAQHHCESSLSSRNMLERSASGRGPLVPRIDVVRHGRAERFLNSSPAVSSGFMQWRGIALENYEVPAVFIPRHEHPEHFLHIVFSGNVRYEVATKGEHLHFNSRPGTIFLLPRGTVDE